MNPYEEIYELIKKMKEAKETIEGTDAEYFEEKHMDDLIKVSQELITLAFGVKAFYESEKED